jgi:hypothetical protein
MTQGLVALTGSTCFDSYLNFQPLRYALRDNSMSSTCAGQSMRTGTLVKKVQALCLAT